MQRDHQRDPINELEETLRRLKVQYDMFFKGSRPLPPTEDHKRFERSIQEMSKERVRDNAKRFRLANLVNKYTLLREIWSRQMREREEGPLDYRRRAAALLHGPEEAAGKEPPRQPVTRETSDSYLLVSSTRDQEMELLHQRLCEARERIGAPKLSLTQFSEMIDRQLGELRTKYRTETIGFRVDVVDGKVRLKAKPIQE